jgi:hypothetical protein
MFQHVGSLNKSYNILFVGSIENLTANQTNIIVKQDWSKVKDE